MTTFAEDIALLLVDPGTGKPVVDGTAFDRVVGGALLLDLAVAERLAVTGSGAKARIAATGGPTGDPLLDTALDRLGSRDRRAAAAVEKLSSKLRAATFARLVDAGILIAEKGRALAVIPTTTWRFTDPRPRQRLQSGIAAVLTGKADPDERQAGLISLLYAVQAEHKIVDGPRKALRARAREVANGEWAGSAVTQAVQAVQATIMTAVVASAGAAGGT
ncbi:MAG: GPP34 family phosphoprotein [Pseudonocardia sp.]|nr:GPP34 family phosphoprotein [Pseudonocardia sp.]